MTRTAISVPVPVPREHGIVPIEFNVLIEPKAIEERTKGGILLAATTLEKEQAAAVEGTVISVSPLAFNYDENAPKAQPGDFVVIAKYSGVTLKGRDGRDYRLVKDKDILAVVGK